MKFTEFYEEYQGRPGSKVSLDNDARGPSIPVGYISGVMLQSTYSVVKLTNSYTPSDTTLILADARNSPITITLPNATDNAGRYYIIKKVDSTDNAVTITPASGEYLDGESSMELTLQYQYITVICSGTISGDSYWHVIGGSNVKMEEILKDIGEQQISLLHRLLDEARQSKLHLAGLSDEPIEGGDGDDS